MRFFRASVAYIPSRTLDHLELDTKEDLAMTTNIVALSLCFD